MSIKKVIIASLIGLGVIANTAMAEDLLTGDTRLSCEAILCLSSGTRPGECNPSIKKYFSIHGKKPSDTIRKRKDFLQLCPVGDEAERDREFTNLRDNILLKIDNGCDIDMLNANIEYRGNCLKESCSNTRCDCDEFEVQQARVNPELDKNCKLLMQSAYTNIRPKFVCSKSFYSIEDWNNGYTLKEISKNEYDKATDRNSVVSRKECVNFNYRTESCRKTAIKYYTKQPINKNCWVNE